MQMADLLLSAAEVASQVAIVVKTLLVSAGNPGLIPGSEDPLEEGMTAPSSTLAWEIPQTVEPGRPQSMGSQESDTTEVTQHAHAGTAETNSTL